MGNDGRDWRDFTVRGRGKNSVEFEKDARVRGDLWLAVGSMKEDSRVWGDGNVW